jgi:hypothetical protein
VGEGRARALRRCALTAAALGATLLAHAAATGGVHVAHVLPVGAAGALGLAALCGRRGRAFRPRGPVVTLGLLLALQAVLHVVVSSVPWAFSLEIHRRVPLLSGGAVLAHGVAALVLTALLVRLDRLLAALCRAGRAFRRRLLPPLLPSPAPVALAAYGPVRPRAVRRPQAPTRGPPGR